MNFELRNKSAENNVELDELTEILELCVRDNLFVKLTVISLLCFSKIRPRRNLSLKLTL